ncbi:MAG TPA: phage head closure protein [bacterium]|nr:phage head closure protein [bacterium]
MRAGELRERITIQRKTTPVAQDGFGGESITWVTLAAVWAKVEALSGREFIGMGRQEAAVTHKVTIRERDDVTPAMRIAWGAQILQIEAVLGGTIMCREVV